MDSGSARRRLARQRGVHGLAGVRVDTAGGIHRELHMRRQALERVGRLGRFGSIGYPIVAERKIEELYGQIKRWTWRGKPTRKAKKLYLLEKKMELAGPLDINKLLRK